MRVILAKKHFSEQNALHSLVTRHVSATKIQSWWRSYYAQVQMLIDIVNIIVVQVSPIMVSLILNLPVHIIHHQILH